MGGIHYYVVVQRLDLLLQAMVHDSRQFFLGHIAAKEVRPAYIAHKQRIAGEHTMGFAGFIAQQVAGAFQRMAGCVHGFDGDIAQRKYLIVGSYMRLKARFGIRAKDDGCARFARQFQMAAHEIGMKMGFENILDRSALFSRHIDIYVHIAQRVYYCGLAVAHNKVRSLAQAIGVQLLNFHNYGLFTTKLLRNDDVIKPTNFMVLFHFCCVAKAFR